MPPAQQHGTAGWHVGQLQFQTGRSQPRNANGLICEVAKLRGFELLISQTKKFHLCVRFCIARSEQLVQIVVVSERPSFATEGDS